MVKKENNIGKSLLEKMKSTGSVGSELLSESNYFNNREYIFTEYPFLNIAFSGSLDGGIIPGLTIIAGDSKTFKTMLSLLCMKAYQDKYEDALCIFYDIEKGTSLDAMALNGIDTSRVLYIKDILNIEEFKLDMAQKLDQINDGDHVFIFVDSIGLLASKKEIDDALDNNIVADMSRAKAITSLSRTIVNQLAVKNIPCIMINHIYEMMDNSHMKKLKGGKGLELAAHQIFIVTRAQDKNEKTKEVEGYYFTINIDKSRAIREKSKVTFNVSYDDYIDKYSGLLDEAIDFGYVKNKGAWYEVEGFEKNIRASDMDADFWENLLKREDFKKFIEKKYKL